MANNKIERIKDEEVIEFECSWCKKLMEMTADEEVEHVETCLRRFMKKKNKKKGKKKGKKNNVTCGGGNPPGSGGGNPSGKVGNLGGKPGGRGGRGKYFSRSRRDTA